MNSETSTGTANVVVTYFRVRTRLYWVPSDWRAWAMWAVVGLLRIRRVA